MIWEGGILCSYNSRRRLPSYRWSSKQQASRACMSLCRHFTALLSDSADTVQFWVPRIALMIKGWRSNVSQSADSNAQTWEIFQLFGHCHLQWQYYTGPSGVEPPHSVSYHHINIYSPSAPPTPCKGVCSKEADTRSPIILCSSFWVHYNVVWEGICIRCCDRRNVVLVAVYNCDDFMCSFFKWFAHGATNFDNIWVSQSDLLSLWETCKRTSFCSWLCQCNVQRPLLPTHILIRFTKEVSLLALLLKELHNKLPSSSLLVCAVYSSYQRYRSLVDQRFKIYVIDSREGKVEQVTGEGRNRCEIAVEEDSMQNRYNSYQLRSLNVLKHWDRRENGRVPTPLWTWWAPGWWMQ